MSRLRRPFLLLFTAIFFVFLIGGAVFVDRASRIAGGYVARDLCVEVFINDQDAEKAQAANFAGLNPALQIISHRTDRQAKTLSAGIWPFRYSRAVFFEGYGCVVKQGKLPILPELAPVKNVPLPKGDPASLGFDAAVLNDVLNKAVADQENQHRAILVMRDGQVAAERYAPGYDAATVMMSASMAKSVTGMMVGAAVQEGLVDITKRAPIREWADPSDPRSAITWTHLLQMQSGLEFDEGYPGVFKDRSKMNVLAHSAAKYAIDKPLLYEPGTKFAYATGTSNIIQHALRNALEAQGVNYHRFAHEKIFGSLGMSRFVFLTDSAGDFIGGSTAYATARDWAKLGQLYLQDGQWDGKQILPANWLELTSTPAEHSNGSYGFQIALNQSGKDGREPYIPSVPTDALVFSGMLGQYVLIVPSLDLVVVHLGRITGKQFEEHPKDWIFGGIVKAVIPR